MQITRLERFVANSAFSLEGRFAPALSALEPRAVRWLPLAAVLFWRLGSRLLLGGALRLFLFLGLAQV
jgi:hypothetical protein